MSEKHNFQPASPTATLRGGPDDGKLVDVRGIARVYPGCSGRYEWRRVPRDDRATDVSPLYEGVWVDDALAQLDSGHV